MSHSVASPLLPPETLATLRPAAPPARSVTADLRLIYWGLTDWEGLRQRPQHLAAALAGSYNVLYVRPAPLSRRRRGPLPLAVEHLSDRLTLLRPRLLSPGRLGFIRRLNEAIATRAIRRHLGASEPVALWLSHPDQASQIGRYGERLVVFDLMDDHAAFKRGAAAARMAAAELNLLRRAGLALASSDELAARARAAGARPLLVPNAVEFERFAAAAVEPLPLPAPLTAIPGPRLLFYGTVGPWVDTALLGALARARPDWSLALVGETAGGDLAPLGGLPNVHLLGRQPYAALPAFLQHCDLCLLPFVQSALTRAVDPVKLYEYLAAGRPVVATPLPELDKCGDLIARAAGPDEWLATIARQLAAPEPAATRQARLAFAAAHTWQDRAALIVDAIEERLALSK
jgi:glycosyltransferase involved in cell wall biosynthesis